MAWKNQMGISNQIALGKSCECIFSKEFFQCPPHHLPLLTFGCIDGIVPKCDGTWVLSALPYVIKSFFPKFFGHPQKNNQPHNHYAHFGRPNIFRGANLRPFSSTRWIRRFWFRPKGFPGSPCIVGRLGLGLSSLSTGWYDDYCICYLFCSIMFLYVPTNPRLFRMARMPKEKC